MQRVAEDKGLERVWKRLATHEKAWSPVTPAGAEYDALRCVVRDLCSPPSVVPAPTKKRLEVYRKALARMEAAYLADPELIDTVPAIADVWLASQRAIHAIDKFDRARWQGLLAPATMTGVNWRINWVALHLRDQTIPAFFEGAHHAAIASLVTAAYPEAQVTADQVRLLKRANP